MSFDSTKPVLLVRRLRAWVARRNSDQLALALPLLIAAVYFARFIETFNERLTAVGGDSDAINPLFIAATMDEVPGADVHMGTFGHYITLWYARATEWLPFDREVWEAIPCGLWLASLVLVIWAAWRAVGMHAAILTGVIGFCISPYLLFMLFTSSYHTWTLYGSAIAAGVFVFLATRTHMGVRVWVIAGLAALVLGGALASDRLVLVAAVAPLMVAAAGIAIRHPTRQGRMVGLAAALVAVVAIAIGAALAEVMEASGFVTESRTEGWIEAHLFFSQAAASLDDALWLFNAYFLGRPVNFESTLSLAIALGVLVGLLAPFIVLRRRLRDLRTADSPVELGRSAYIFFWAATMGIVPLAAIASDQNVAGGARYFLPVVLAVAAAAPLLARSVAARYVVIAAISTYALLGVLNIADRDKDGDLRDDASRVATQANELISITREEQVHVGYAGYWEAASSSWSTKMKVKVFPVEHDCGTADEAPCPYSSRAHGGWYVPRPGIRSFLIGPKPQDDDFYEPPASLGQPASTYRLLNGADLYVYPYDIAERFPPFRGERQTDT